MSSKRSRTYFIHIFVIIVLICFTIGAYLQDKHMHRAYHFKSQLLKVSTPFDIILNGEKLEEPKLHDRILFLDEPTNEISFSFVLPHYEELDGYIPFLYFKAANYEVTAYCDGQLIFSRRYQTEKLHKYQNYEGVAINFIELPSDYEGREITITLKNHLQAFSRYQFQTIYIGNETAVILNALSYGFTSLFFGITTFFVGVILLLLILITRKSRNFSLGSIALFIINLGVWLVSQSHAKFLFSDNSAATLCISYLSLFSLPPLTIYVLNSYYIFEKNRFYKILENISLYGLTLIGLFYLLSDTTPLSMRNFLIYFGAYALLFELIITGYLVYLAIRNQNKMLKNPIIALSFILFAIIMDEVLLAKSVKLSTLSSFFILYFPYLIASFFLIRDVMKIYINEAKTSAAKEILYQIYSTDSQTGAITRSCFEENLNNKKLKIKRDSVIFFIDIDNMKKFNDAEGHSIGDLLIESVGKTVEALKKELELELTFVKYGGDEFLIIVPPMIGFDANNFKKHLEEEYRYHCFSKTTLSVGYSVYFDKSLEEAIAEADEMMFKAKAFRKRFSLEDL